MPGAPIPDDWDGSSYRCVKVFYPDSEQYRAILLGQITEPTNPLYWDGNSGDPDEASSAVLQAELLTLPEFDTVDCDIALLPQNIPIFKYYLSEEQTIPASGFHRVEFDAGEYSYNSPDFNTTTHEHKPTTDDLLGLWLYEVLIGSVGAVNFTARIMSSVGTTELMRMVSSGGSVLMVMPFYLENGGGESVYVEVNFTSETNLNANIYRTHFAGYKLGTVA